MSKIMSINIYRPQRSWGQGYVFTRVCDSVHREGLRAGRTPWAGRNPLGRENPSTPGRPPWTRQTPQTRQTPPDQADPPDPPGQGGTPPWQGESPPDQTDPPRPGRPPRKQSPEYGLRAAGTHPTGMHSCLI